VEDEMYEVDMAIERNAQTLKHLQPMAEEMTKLKDAEEKAGQPIGRIQYKLKPRSLNSIHIGAIGRVYGDSGDEVIQHLLINPLMVVPIVYQRMKEKDVEWRKTKEELMKEWKEEMKTNHGRSLDVKSHFYKNELEKCLADESLIEVCSYWLAFARYIDIGNIVHLSLSLFEL
jgi:paired amphipathic helix protein Sin3a